MASMIEKRGRAKPIKKATEATKVVTGEVVKKTKAKTAKKKITTTAVAPERRTPANPSKTSKSRTATKKSAQGSRASGGKKPKAAASKPASAVVRRTGGSRARAKLSASVPVPAFEAFEDVQFEIRGYAGNAGGLEKSLATRVPKSLRAIDKTPESDQPSRFAPAAQIKWSGVVPRQVEPISSETGRSLVLTLSKLSTKLSVVPSSTQPKALRPISLGVNPDMDPRLQLALANGRTGKCATTSASANQDEVAVLARVSDLQAWKNNSYVHHGMELGTLDDASYLVSGRIPIARAETVRRQPWVISLKAAQPVLPALRETVLSMRVSQDLLPTGAMPAGGKGVVIGIVDFGGDFVHPNFRDEQGNTRLLALWNQGDTKRASDRVPYGRVYDRAQINAALATPDPYAALRYLPGRESHGTHVMDIAAGNGAGTAIPGVATQADIVFVEVSASDIPWDGPEAAKYAFGDSVQLAEAVRFIFETAGDRPCVINLSLGTNGGPHDGSSIVEQTIDRMTRERPGRAVVIAASNSQEDGIHTDGLVPVDESKDVEWHVHGWAGGESEIWYDSPAELEATLVGPDGTAVMTLAPGTNQALEVDGNIAVFGSSRLREPNSGSHVIAIWLAPGLEGGTWTVRLRSTNRQAVSYHAWVERMDPAQGYFLNPTFTHTLGSISTGRESVVVGSYDAHVAGFPLSPFSSCGPTRDGRNKPEISAPGHQVYAACSRETDALVRKSGTSMAAPAVSGLIALLFAEASRKGQSLTIDQIRERVQRNCEFGPPSQGVWDPRYGIGRASGKSVP